MSPSSLKKVGQVLVDRAAEETDYYSRAASVCQSVVQVRPVSTVERVAVSVVLSIREI